MNGAANFRHKLTRKISDSTAFAIIVIVLLVLVFWSRIAITVPAGFVGVLWHRFGGTVPNYHCGEGLRFIFPWDKIFLYNVRLRRIDQEINSLTRDGLPVSIFASTSYVVESATVAELHKSVGPEFERTLLRPLISAEISLMVAGRTSDELYSLSRLAIMTQITAAIQKALRERTSDMIPLSNAVRMVNVDVRTVGLPPDLLKAINSKLIEQQHVLQFNYVLQKERLESRRKVIEAEGVRDFQQVVTPSISDSYLRWRGIEATLNLATSPNSKVVVIGSGPGGLPIILGGFDDKSPAVSAPSASTHPSQQGQPVISAPASAPSSP